MPPVYLPFFFSPLHCTFPVCLSFLFPSFFHHAPCLSFRYLPHGSVLIRDVFRTEFRYLSSVYNALVHSFACSRVDIATTRAPFSRQHPSMSHCWLTPPPFLCFSMRLRIMSLPFVREENQHLKLSLIILSIAFFTKGGNWFCFAGTS